MSDSDAGFRHHCLNLPSNLLDVVNSVVDKIDLPVAVQFAHDGLALGEGSKMLLGAHGGWHEDGDLFAVVDGFEGGADGQLGFAVAHVSANEPIHGPAPLHVVLDLTYRAHLVGGFLKRESGFEF